MNDERKSMIVTLAIIVIVSGLITLGIALTMTTFSLFVMSLIEVRRHMTENEEPSDILWRNDIF